MSRFSYREQYAKYSRYFQNLRREYEQKAEVKESIELLLTFLTISFFIVFALRPTINTITELVASVNSQKEIKNKLETKLTDLGKARQSFTQQEKRLFLVDQALPRDPAPDFFLRQLEGLVATHSLNLRSFSVSESLLHGQPSKDIKEPRNKPLVAGTKLTAIAFVINGGFENTMGFLQDLENLRQIFTVETFSFGTGKAGSGDNVILTVAGTITNYPLTK